MDRKEVIEKVRKEAEERKALDKEERVARIAHFFNNLHAFKTVDDIPDVPILEKQEDYNDIVVKNLVRCGAIPKEQLKVGATYEGACRNATEATWDGRRFCYKRYKFGDWFDDDVNHFQDDDGYDVFVPIREKK